MPPSLWLLSTKTRPKSERYPTSNCGRSTIKCRLLHAMLFANVYLTHTRSNHSSHGMIFSMISRNSSRFVVRFQRLYSMSLKLCCPILPQPVRFSFISSYWGVIVRLNQRLPQISPCFFIYMPRKLLVVSKVTNVTVRHDKGT